LNQQAEKRSLGFWNVWGLVVGGAIGAAVFLLPTVLAPYGSLSIVGWLFSAFAMVAVAMTLGNLARSIPKIGGPYAYAKAAFGDLTGFMIAWSFWVSVWVGVAAIAVGLTGYLGVFVPAISDNPAMSAFTAILFLCIFTAINVAGVKTAATLNLVLTILKLLPLFAVGAAGLLLGEVTSIPAADSQGEPFMFFFAGLFLITMGAFVGIEAGTVPADDIIEPDKTIPRALFIGSLTIAAIYILGTAGVMAIVSTEELASSASPFSAAASEIFGFWGAKIIALGAIISILGVLNVTILLTGQMPLAAAQDGLFPAHFASVNVHGAPAFGLIISSLLAALVIGMNYTGGVVAAYEALFLMTTIAAIVVYAACAGADLVLQLRAGKAGAKLRWQSILTALIAFTVSIFAIVGAGLEVAAYTGLLLVAGLPVFFWSRSTAATNSGSGNDAV
jgi:APA family basic amino acid/polyamine antiporter